MEVKMGSKDSNGFVEVQKIHTGTLTPTTLVVSKIGMENHITDKKQDQVKTIELDKNQMRELINECAEDLKVSRKILMDNSEVTIKLISEYDPRNLIFAFNYDINYINKAFKIKEKELSDFLSNFFYSNLNTYCRNLYGGQPINIPMTSIENLQNNRVIFTIHS